MIGEVKNENNRHYGGRPGKTTALGILKQMGCETIDCDAVYHELCAATRTEGGARLPFGDVLTAGAVDRKKLGAIVFQDCRRASGPEPHLP